MKSLLHQINDSISRSGKKQSAGSIYIDTFHHFYAVIPEKFIWPSFHINDIRPEEKEEVTNILLKYVPSFIEGCSILPEPRPRKDSDQVHFVRHYRIMNTEYIYIFKVSCDYMGGAEKNEIIVKGRQGVTPSYRTDRIYFSSLLIPVCEVSRDSGGYIDNFIPIQIKDAIFNVSSDDEKRTFMGTILFDEIDFSQVNERITNYFEFQNAWLHKNLFYPFIIEYLSLCMNVVIPLKEFVDQYAFVFEKIFHTFVQGGSSGDLPEQDILFLNEYYKNWSFERILSRSGNPHWRIEKYPNLNYSLGS